MMLRPPCPLFSKHPQHHCPSLCKSHTTSCEVSSRNAGILASEVTSLPTRSQLPSPSPFPTGSTGSSLTAHQSLPPAPDTWLQPGWGPVRGKSASSPPSPSWSASLNSPKHCQLETQQTWLATCYKPKPWARAVGGVSGIRPRPWRWAPTAQSA